MTNIVKRIIQRLSATTEKIDYCISGAAVEGPVKSESVFNETVRLKKNGIKNRNITEIIMRNLP